MNQLWNPISEVLIGNGLIAAFLFAGIVVLLSNMISEKLLRGRIHSSAVAIFLGLIAAYIGGAITGGEKGLSDIAVFSGLGILGGSTLRNFTIIAASYGAKMSEIKKAGAAGFVSLFVGIASSYTMGAIVALAFGYRGVGSVSTIAASSRTSCSKRPASFPSQNSFSASENCVAICENRMISALSHGMGRPA